MPSIKVEQSLLTWLQSRHGISYEPEQLKDELPLIGADIDRCDNEMLEIEIFPDRPDMLSAETLAHTIRPFLHGCESQPELEVVAGEVRMDVDASLEHVRPVILAAIVRGVDVGETSAEKDQFIKSLMDHQEKLHFALGRGRKRTSIGVHDLSMLAPPFRVVSVSRDFSFIPLAMSEPMSIEAILSEHPKGIDYAHLLEGMERVPVILDADDAVLSFPPIINGDHTTVNHDTSDFFIDVTGWDERACESALLLTCLQLAGRGGRVESVQVRAWDEDEFACPDGSPRLHEVPRGLVSSLLGWNFDDEELSNAIRRMGGRYVGSRPADADSPDSNIRMADAAAGDDWLQFEMPRWRFDILHPVDLVEELAIGHGYEDLGSMEPTTSMAGIPRSDAHLMRRMRESLQGLGLQQVQSLTLSNDLDQFTSVRWPQGGEVTRITNPITGEHTMLRQSVLPSLLRLIAANRHHVLPQGIYEVGACVRGHSNVQRAAWLMADGNAGFADARGFAQALLRDLGAGPESITLQALPAGHGPWLSGRSAQVLISGQAVGEIGEMDPRVSEIFDLKVPMHGAEFDVSALADSIPDPVL